MNEYRCTRFRPYTNPGCPGYADKGSRQGYYITAPNSLQALMVMAQEHPLDVDWGIRFGEEPFTCDLWAENVDKPEIIYHG